MPGRSMSLEQERHLVHLKHQFVELNDKKYRAGAKEHGTNLYEFSPMELALNLREEAIDAFNYAQTLIDQLEKENGGESS